MKKQIDDLCMYAVKIDKKWYFTSSYIKAMCLHYFYRGCSIQYVYLPDFQFFQQYSNLVTYMNKRDKDNLGVNCYITNRNRYIRLYLDIEQVKFQKELESTKFLERKIENV